MNCIACNAKLSSDIVDPGTEFQFDKALWVGFFGGYGMFVDDIDTPYKKSDSKLSGAAHEAVLCHECAHELCANNPWIKNLLEPAVSHAHTKAFWANNPNHEGWDNPAIKLF